MCTYTATYSPDDNKLRLYASQRLDAATYKRVKDAGYRWAPRQELFVCPAWSPRAEDIALELAGEISDEDTSLVDRAEDRAERFSDYSGKRSADALRAHDSVAAIADNIPLGQPILIGHHSEKRARKDAERIQNGMRRAVKMWETSEYWKSRAAGALRAAKYKELPGVRARRIKKLEAEQRGMERRDSLAGAFLLLWNKPGVELTRERALAITSRDHVSQCFPLADFPRDPPASQYEGAMGLWSALDGGVINPEQARAIAERVHTANRAYCARWLTHLALRLDYERAMLGESGGLPAERVPPEIGGAVMCWVSRGLWSYVKRVNKGSVTVMDNWCRGGVNFRRIVKLDDVHAVMTADEVAAARAAGRLGDTADGCAFALAPEIVDAASTSAPDPVATTEAADVDAPDAASPTGERETFLAMREQLRAGVQVVAAPQLFPTPLEIAARMVDLADIAPGHRVLEPSAGTGVLLGSMGGRMFGHAPERGAVYAVEIVPALAKRLRRDFPLTSVECADFLSLDLSHVAPFDRIVMNPPFADGADIRHIEHARSLLAPGGLLVALCANGPRQCAKLQPIAQHWEALPPGSFKEAGTGVNVALLVIAA